MDQADVEREITRRTEILEAAFQKIVEEWRSGGEAIKVSVSATQKVNVGNYESVDVFFALSNVPVGATDEDLAAAMATSELTFTHVKAKVIQEVASIRRKMEQ